MITEDDTVAERRCTSCGTVPTDPTFLFCTACGSRLDAGTAGKALVPAASAADPLDEEDRTRSWWVRHRKLLVIGAAVALAVGAGSFVSWQWTGFRTADGPVREFFTALADRDGPAAATVLREASFLNHTMISTDEEILASPLWQAGALDAGYIPPELDSVSVEYFLDAGHVDQRPDKSLARATATFTLEGAAFDMEFLMEREKEGWDRSWAVGAVAMGLVPLGGDTGGAQVANATVDGAVFAPPGVYDIAVTENALFTATAGQVLIGGDDYVDDSGRPDPTGEPSAVASTAAPTEEKTGEGDGPLGGAPLEGTDWELVTTSTLEYALQADAAETVDAQIRSTIDVCAAPHALDFETCPFTLTGLDEALAPSVASALDGGSEWTIDAYPEVELVVDVAGWVRVQVLQAGHATGDYLGPEDGPGLSLLWDDYEAELIPYGRVGVDAGAIVWTYTP